MQRLNSLLHVRPALRLTNLSYHPKFYPSMSVNAPSAAETDAQAEKVANTSGITTESLQKTITEKLEAKHVDIEDMSGEMPLFPHPSSLSVMLTIIRRMWPNVSSHDRLTTLREEE